MSTPIKSTDHDALNAAFAEHVCGTIHVGMKVPGEDGKGVWLTSKPLPDYTRSADAVLPWLNKTFCVWSYHPDRPPGHLCADTTRDYHKLIEAHGEFPHAAVIALLRAKGVQVQD